MVTLLPGYPAHVAAYRAKGRVDAREYESVVMKRVNRVARRYGRVNFLVRMETDIGNYSFASFLKYLVISFKHFSKWERMAIVTDEKWVREVYSLLSPLVHGEIRAYKLSEYEAARRWVSGSFTVRPDTEAVVNSGVLGTSVMTAFSHLLSDITHDNLSEPELLGRLYKEWQLPGHGQLGRIAGWHLHYTMGVGWTALYALFLRKGWLTRKLSSSLKAGAVSGIVSVAAWEAMLRSTPNAPRINKLKFYGQLVPAHVLFAFIAIQSLSIASRGSKFA
jgi:hypothetical protein